MIFGNRLRKAEEVFVMGRDEEKAIWSTLIGSG
jgi:hypothetical protein